MPGPYIKWEQLDPIVRGVVIGPWVLGGIALGVAAVSLLF